MTANTTIPVLGKLISGLKNSGSHWVIWGRPSVCACTRYPPP
ncbi:rCG38969 [Rattus norvegicus]|uniref:RCG38969 n=1 Tax=Rattus norvegicus TaxID=10116 RepID=A6KL94_RAT|nr:rCG38969 [Rattus norvegicus]